MLEVRAEMNIERGDEYRTETVTGKIRSRRDDGDMGTAAATNVKAVTVPLYR